MSEPKKEICNNCGTEMEIVAADTYYCEKCDKTFVIKNGKQFVAPQKTLLDQLKEGYVNLNQRVAKIEEKQKPDDSLDGFLFG